MKESPVERKTRKKYDTTFKREAVAHWLKSGKSAWQVARELGISQTHLYDWKVRFGPADQATQSDLEEQIKKLQRENELLREQRDILKKTLGIVSEPPPNGINGSKP